LRINRELLLNPSHRLGDDGSDLRFGEAAELPVVFASQNNEKASSRFAVIAALDEAFII
jgi:hypothetical protein